MHRLRTQVQSSAFQATVKRQTSHEGLTSLTWHLMAQIIQSYGRHLTLTYQHDT